MTVLTVQACYVAEELYGHSCGGLTHGGEIEALAVLAHRPDLVHLDRIDYSSDHAHGRKMDKLRRTRSLSAGAARHPHDRADRLVRRPQHATAEKGHADAERHRRRDREGGARASSAARRGAGRHGRDQAPAAGRAPDGAAHQASQAKKLGLAGPQLARDRSRARSVRASAAASPRSRCRSPATAARAASATTASRSASTCSRARACTSRESGEHPLQARATSS